MGSRKTRGALLSGVLAVGIASFVTAAFADPDGDAGPGKAKAKAKNDVYIVRMADSPVVAYEGGLPGYQATKPRKGTKINPNDPKVVRYATYLDARHDGTVARVGGRKNYSYRYVFNGFAASLTPTQAEALKSAPGVLSVEKDELYEMDTSFTPSFLGMTLPDGILSKAKGENVIIGIVDSGVWPEHPSYSDRTGVNGNATRDGKLGYQQIPGWHGKCTPGEGFTGSDCNHKLIGARYYNAGWGGNAAIDHFFPFEFNSPRDWAGHGTHTSTTAGGNANVQATGPAAGLGKISGIAPRARIAAYKVCWADQPTGGGCFGSDSVAAIDQAVADGVDVINFSISGTRTNFRDAVEIAFMFAADAGVFVAASAGNAGANFTVAHPGPWLTTVAAGTHSRGGTGSVDLGDNTSAVGASFAAAVPSKPIILAKDAFLAPATAAQAELCLAAADNVIAGVPTPVLDPAKVAGRIVMCKRGSNVLVNKSAAVAAAGGAGAVIFNAADTAATIFALTHAVPTVHVVTAEGAKILTYMESTPTPTASIAQATITTSTPAPLWATFSSRGPLLAGAGDLLKPDLMAPGQDILAGVAPPNNGGQLFGLYQGTSMSSPHVAGLAALLKELRPEWSPMAIKSALMTTAGDILDGPNTSPGIIFAQGAGHVRPNDATDPGLVFDAGLDDWMSFICGTQPGAFCATIPAMDPSDLNVASIAIGNMAGVQTVKRRVTNVSGSAATFTASTTGMAGFTVLVSPATFDLARGATEEITVTFTRTTASLNFYAGGQLRFTSNASPSHIVRVPMVVVPVALAAPASVFSDGSPVSYDVTFGFSGPFTAAARGLVPAALTVDTVADDPTNGSCSLATPNAKLIEVVIPAGTTHARFSLFDADVSAGADIDLCVFLGTVSQGSSGSGTSAEEVNLVNPAAGTYTVVVHGWGVAGTSPFKLHTWLVGGAAAGNMAVSFPAMATIGNTGTIDLSFTGLAAGTKYMGSVAYTGATGLPVTLVRVDTP